MPYTVTLFTIAITVVAYLLSRWIFLRYRNPMLNPVVLSTLAVIAILLLCRLSFEEYKPGKEIMSFLLGPATVALALPLYRHRQALVTYIFPILTGVAVGAISTMAAVIWIGWMAGLSRTILLSLAPKSVTAPIAVEISRIIGGDPSLTTAFVVTTGMIGSMIGPLLLSRLGVTNPVARGLAIGTTAHGQGTAIALMEGETQGAMSGIAMALAGVVTSLVAPGFIHDFRLNEISFAFK